MTAFLAKDLGAQGGWQLVWLGQQYDWRAGGAAACWLPRLDLSIEAMFQSLVFSLKAHVLDFYCELRDAQTLQ